MEKKVRLISLYELYQQLFTEKQQAYFEEYYFEDLSLAEIAENHQVSRNAVHDQVKKVEHGLETYEAKLGMLEMAMTYEQLLEKIYAAESLETVKALLDEARIEVEVTIGRD
ncbi:hypothetical protein FEZ08_09760 [Culicoidibacter larvae]|uniref:UPF0122 protein FEZ08_09760 n=1 Tax=Culicoidibacter larvae TaxID=2579976 RepID=A0A5R8Q9P2_9FIRM|nr:hypothetical protein FEZ08_09760 [Culicoidibacter larvae]